MSALPDVGLSLLIGAWRLASAWLTFTDNQEKIEPYGPDPDGHMVFEPGARIMFLFTKSNRPVPVTDTDRAALFNDMTAYTGRVRPDGPGRFITTIDLGWTPAWRGEQLRFYVLDGDRLTIRSPEQTHPGTANRLLVAELVWTREAATV